MADADGLPNRGGALRHRRGRPGPRMRARRDARPSAASSIRRRAREWPGRDHPAGDHDDVNNRVLMARALCGCRANRARGPGEAHRCVALLGRWRAAHVQAPAGQLPPALAGDAARLVVLVLDDAQHPRALRVLLEALHLHEDGIELLELAARHRLVVEGEQRAVRACHVVPLAGIVLVFLDLQLEAVGMVIPCRPSRAPRCRASSSSIIAAKARAPGVSGFFSIFAMARPTCHDSRTCP